MSYAGGMDNTAIRHYREARGLTQRQLGERLGVFERTVAAWEQGRQRPAPYIDRALRDLDRELADEPAPAPGSVPGP